MEVRLRTPDRQVDGENLYERTLAFAGGTK
jgi:hypothetical protein